MKATAMFAGEASRSAGAHQTERLSRQFRVLADRLPDMIDGATTAYERLAARETADDVKSVAAHQAALQSALAHLEALLSLAHRLDPPSGGGSAQNDHDLLEHLCREAAAAVAAAPEEEED
jgi:hypothetical protein